MRRARRDSWTRSASGRAHCAHFAGLGTAPRGPAPRREPTWPAVRGCRQAQESARRPFDFAAGPTRGPSGLGSRRPRGNVERTSSTPHRRRRAGIKPCDCTNDFRRTAAPSRIQRAFAHASPPTWPDGVVLPPRNPATQAECRCPGSTIAAACSAEDSGRRFGARGRMEKGQPLGSAIATRPRIPAILV